MATASAVSRWLGAKFTKSESHTTRIRGWHNRTSGYKVRGTGGQVLVWHSTGSNWSMSPEDQKAQTEKALTQYTDRLSERYTVTRIGNDLIVTDKEDQS